MCLPDESKLVRQLSVLLAAPGGTALVAFQDGAPSGSFWRERSSRTSSTTSRASISRRSTCRRTRAAVVSGTRC
ncbi:hypothetical protein NKG05_28975 [Oerskovia sp. M15]